MSAKYANFLATRYHPFGSARAGQGLDLTVSINLLSEGEAYLCKELPCYEACGCVAKFQIMKNASIIPQATCAKFQRREQSHTDPKIHRNNRNGFNTQVRNNIRIEANSREGATSKPRKSSRPQIFLLTSY